MPGKVIAIDFDDLMAATFETMMKEHNLLYGTDLTSDDLSSTFLYQIRGWGTPLQVEGKLKEMGDLLTKTPALPGLLDALTQLHSQSHKLHIVTARGAQGRENVSDWLTRQGISFGSDAQDLISGLHFAGSWQNADEVTKDTIAKSEIIAPPLQAAPTDEMLLATYKKSVQSGKGALTKLEIFRHVGADMFIDDSYTNLGPMFTADGRKPQCILFGKYAWTDRRATFEDPADSLTFAEREAAGVENFGSEVIPCLGVDKISNWPALVAYVGHWSSAV